MPEISRFYGIVIRMFFADHNPPHFHAEYGGHQAVLGIETLAVISGKLPPRALGLVAEWATNINRSFGARGRGRKILKRPGKIDPLP